MMTVYLIRTFVMDLIEHLAVMKNPETAVKLDSSVRRSFGVGNSTGLGMAPFLINHPRLIHNWFEAKENAIATVKNIEDATHNTTRFLFMKENFEETRIKDIDYITSFIFQVRNIPSALFKALGGFSTNKINMLKLESYMLKGSFKATQFYVDIEGHPEDDNVKQAFEELGFFSKEVKILGYYPSSELRKG